MAVTAQFVTRNKNIHVFSNAVVQLNVMQDVHVHVFRVANTVAYNIHNIFIVNVKNIFVQWTAFRLSYENILRFK